MSPWSASLAASAMAMDTVLPPSLILRLAKFLSIGVSLIPLIVTDTLVRSVEAPNKSPAT